MGDTTLHAWGQRFRDKEIPADPHPLLVETVRNLPPGRALDLACGLGRNAIYLAELGWDVTAVDGSEVAIAKLKDASNALKLPIQIQLTDLETAQFSIRQKAWDLIVCCLYFQRELIEPIQQGLKPNGLLIATALMAKDREENSTFRVRSGELTACFSDLEILHQREVRHATHCIAEIVARKPSQSE